MTLFARIRHGLEPAFIAAWFVGSVAVGFIVWELVSSGAMCPVLQGGMVFAPALGFFTFVVALSGPPGERWLGWPRSVAFQLLFIAVFVAAALLSRSGLEYVSLAGLPRLHFLSGFEVIWRIPVSLFAGGLAFAMAARFVFVPKEEEYDGPNIDERVIRGPRYVSYIEAKARYAAKAGRDFVIFAFVSLPLRLARHGILILGAPGAGKTVLLFWLIRSFIRLIARDPAHFRAVICPDPKNDYRAFIEQEFGQSSLNEWFIHPLDQGSLAWDIAQDLDDETAFEFATAFFPRRAAATADGGFFDGTAIKDLTGLLNGFRVKFGTNFTLADVFEQAGTPEGLLEALRWDASNVTNAQCIARYAEGVDTRLADNCFHTFAEKAEPYYLMAAAMREQWKRGQRFSIRRWAKDSRGGVVVVGWSANHEAQMKSLVAAFMAILRRELLAQPSSEVRHTLVAIDEAASAGDIAGEADLLLREGRSRNVVVALAVHTVAAMRSASRSRDAVEAVLAEPQNVAVLRLTCPETAMFAARRLSGEGTEIERTQVTESVTPDEKGQPKKSRSTVVVRETKHLVSPAQLISSPTVDDPDVGPNGFANTDQGNVYKFHYQFSSMTKDLPLVRPFIAKPFDPESLRLQIPERHRPNTSEPSEDKEKPKKKRKRSRRPVDPQLFDDDDDLPYRSN